MSQRNSLERFVPRIATEWDTDGVGTPFRQIDGTLCFVDISGFTMLSEKLARRGRIGAEELTEVLDRVFGEMLRLAYDRGGSLLKFGGDALLLMFEGVDHPVQGVSAAVEMRAALRQATQIPTSVGRIPLRMSVGLHTGPIDLYLVGRSHRELVITGETATKTTEMEAGADAGEILISPELAEVLHPSAVGDRKGPGHLLRWRQTRLDPSGVLHRKPVGPEVLEMCVPVGLREHVIHGRAEPEHRVAAVGFIKFKGIGAAMSDGGHALVAEHLSELVGAVQDAVDPEGITFLATDIDADGGKIILTAGAPITQEDDEGRMLRAVRAIADRRTALSLKIGVNRGHVFAGEIGTAFRSTYTVMGDTVNLAARLMAAAPPGEIYATPGMLDRSRTLFVTAALEPFYVKGKSKPVQAYAVGEEAGTRTTDSHASLPFRGREGELETIRSAISEVDEGNERRVIVVGETGMGKTRLVEESLRDADVTVFRIQGEANGTDNPYWALRDPLRRLLGIERTSQAEMADRLGTEVARLAPDLVPMLPLLGDVTHIDLDETDATRAIEPRFRPDRTAGALSQLLSAACPGTLVLVAEDRHWMDGATVTLLDKLSGRPMLLLITTRPPADDPAHVRLDLTTLDNDATRSIALDATAATPLRHHELEAVIARSGGNPLFLEEILRLIRETGSAESLPESLDAVVGAEIDTLPPLARRLLRYSSVLGRSFRRVVLDELLAPEQVELDSATRQALSRFVTSDGPDRWRFRHAVMHDVAYEGLSFRKRKELHARAGEVIERLAAADTAAVAEFLALHYARAGNHERAWRFGLVAADKAKAAYANVEAARHYERALESARRLRAQDPTATLSAWRSLAAVREQAGLFSDSLKALRAARSLASDNRVLLADLHLDAARARLRTGQYVAALRETALGLRLLDREPGNDAAMARARLLSIRAWARLQQGRPRDALDIATRAAEAAEESGETDALARAYTVLDNSYELLGQPGQAVYEPRALSLYEAANDMLGVATVANNLGVRAYAAGRWSDAVATYSRSRDAFRLVGNEPQAALAGANLGEVLVSLDRLTEAIDVLTDARRVLRAHDLGDFAIFADAQLARVETKRGNPARAAEDLAGLTKEAFEIGHTGIALDATVHLAEALLADGEIEAAIRAIEDGERLGGGDAAYFEVPLSRLKAAALARMGQEDRALELAELALAAARDQQLPYEEALVLLLKSEILGRDLNEEGVQEAERLLHSLRGEPVT
jgi:class 3 adenylate cyclase/predicted ATPase